MTPAPEITQEAARAMLAALKPFAWAAEAASSCAYTEADALELLNDAKARVSWAMFASAARAIALAEGRAP